MDSASLVFIAFGLAAAAAYNFWRSIAWRQAVLLFASMLFLWTLAPSWQSLIPFTAFLALGYLGLRTVAAGWHRPFVFIVFGIVAAFMWLKRYTFIPGGLFLHQAYVTLGMSYVLFRILHLVIDARYGDLDGRIDPVSYLNYTLNFATLVSGPIQLYPDFAANQLALEPRPVSVRRMGEAIERIIVGFFKANVLALPFSAAHELGLAALRAQSPLENKIVAAAIAFASYPFFLYCNFSGYIDIVIGIGALMRNTLPENFNRPFSSDSFICFWSRWHITLSEWLKRYVYYPVLMGLMRKFPARSVQPLLACFAFFLTFFLVGVWHGQNSVFLFFGLLQGLGVAGNKMYELLMVMWLGRKGYRSLTSGSLYIALARGATFTWFTFTMIWFWSNWREIDSFGAMLGATGWLAAIALIGVVSTIALAAWEVAREWLLGIEWNGSSLVRSRYLRTAYATAALVIGLAAVVLSGQPPPEIVYKTF